MSTSWFEKGALIIELAQQAAWMGEAEAVKKLQQPILDKGYGYWALKFAAEVLDYCDIPALQQVAVDDVLQGENPLSLYEFATIPGADMALIKKTLKDTGNTQWYNQFVETYEND